MFFRNFLLKDLSQKGPINKIKTPVVCLSVCLSIRPSVCISFKMLKGVYCLVNRFVAVVVVVGNAEAETCATQ